MSMKALSTVLETIPFESAAEQDAIYAATEAIRLGFNATGAKRMTAKHVADACIIIVTFLKEMERVPQRSVAEWRAAVENLKIAFGSST